MYIKWITCHVKNDKKLEFSIAQEKWHKTVIAKGFIAQTGGWDSINENLACIISFWESKNHLENFMKDIHDKIFDKNKQANTYNSITVQYFNSLLDTKSNTQSLKNTIQNSKLLKTADCYVKVDKEEYYEKIQKEIWLPKMKKTKGVLEGIFSKSPSNTSHYFISTFWDNPENHTIYNKLVKHKLKKNNNIKKITGKHISLVDSWKIISKT